jgi:hypothetical protein
MAINSSNLTAGSLSSSPLNTLFTGGNTTSTGAYITNTIGGYFNVPNSCGSIVAGHYNSSIADTYIEILGKTFSLTGYLGNDVKILLASVDFHGISFWKSAKKMNMKTFSLQKDIEEFLDAELKRFERSEKIKATLKDDNS